MNPLLSALVAAGIISQAEAERINRQMDPAAARAWAEEQLAIAVQQGLTAQQARLVELVRRSNGTLTAAQIDAFWRAEDDALYASIAGTLDAIATERAISIVVGAGNADMWTQVNQAVLDWTHAYYTGANPDFVGSVRSLDQTSRVQVADAFARWNRGELEGTGLPALIAELEPTFGASRATVIAATEVTRIFGETEQAALEADPDLEYLTWTTVNDELVCPICGPLNGRSVRSGEDFTLGVRLPPAHVSCRCTVTASTAPVEERLGNRNSRQR